MPGWRALSLAGDVGVESLKEGGVSRRTDETAQARPWGRVAAAVAAMALTTCTVTTVAPVTVDQVTVEPPRVEARVMDEVPLSVFLQDEDGNPVTGRAVVWSSLDSNVATVDEEGVVTITGSGETFVTATVDGAVGVAQVTSPREPESRVALSDSRIELRTTVGGKVPDKKEVRVTNGGSGSLTGLNVRISYQGRSGWLAAELSRSSAPATLTLRATTNSLPPGDYDATVRVSGGDTDGTVRVIYKVRPPS